MARKQGKIRSRLEYAAVLFGYALLSWPPLWLAKAIAHTIADIWRCLDQRHGRRIRRQAMDRLGISEAEAGDLAKRNYRHYLLLFMEIARLNRMSDAEVYRRTDRNGCDAIMRDLLAKGKGMVVVTGHLGNWEWGAVAMGMLGVVHGFIARPLDNPYLDAFINSIRERTGATVWDKFGSMRKGLGALRKGQGLVAVADQDGGKNGCLTPFLDKMGTSMTAPVDLAIRNGAPVFVGAVLRVKGEDMRFVMVPKRVHWPREGADPKTEVTRLMTEVNTDLSEIIRDYPEQWIWIHNRWKSVDGGDSGA